MISITPLRNVQFGGAVLGLTTVLSVMSPCAAADPTSDEIRTVVAEMLVDAEARSSLLQDEATAGYDGKFFLASPDGDFRLNIGGLLQFRYTFNHREVEGETEGFELSRSRIWFTGEVYDSISFYLRGQFSGTYKIEGFEEASDSGALVLDRAWIKFKFDDVWSLAIGQQVSQMTRENEHAPQDQLGVASSPTDSVFGLGGFMGAELHARGENTRAWFTVSNGGRVVRSDFDNPRNADYALSVKVDHKFAGEWGQFSNFTSARGSEFAVMIGAGVHYEQGAVVGAPAMSTDLLLAVAELSFEGNGWNAYAQFQYAYDNVESPNFGSDIGFVVQGGYYIADPIEIYGRFDMVIPDNDRAVENDVFQTLTAGFNYYVFPGSNALKFSTDLTYFFNAESTSIVSPNTNTSVLASAEDNQFAVRVQLSLLF